MEFFLLHSSSSYAQKCQVHDFISLMLYDPANHASCAQTNKQGRIFGSEKNPKRWALHKFLVVRFYVTSWDLGFRST